MSNGNTGTVKDFGPEEFRRRLSGAGVGVRIGPFDAWLRVSVPGIFDSVYDLYRDYPLVPKDSVFSFHVRLETVRSGPTRFARKIRFSVDGRRPHEDMPVAHALPVLEWGINLVIALRSHNFLMLHSAVVERGGRALLMPAAPGFGKTTLCAALVHRGWRLFSDEFGLMRPGAKQLLPLPRPMALKNESIDVIRRFADDAFLGPRIEGTRKGTVAHVRPTENSIAAQESGAAARWIVFPRWAEGAPLTLERLPKAEAFMMLASNAFNYELLGESAFTAVKELIEGADCYRMDYSDLGEATRRLTGLADADGNA